MTIELLGSELVFGKSNIPWTYLHILPNCSYIVGAMQTNWMTRICIQSLITSALVGGDWPASWTGLFIPEKAPTLCIQQNLG